MANSSDWIEAARSYETAAPSWLAGLGEPRGFVEGLPFAASTKPQSGPVPEPAAQAEPQARERTERQAAADALEDAFAKGESAGRAAALSQREAAQDRQRALRLAFQTFDQAAMDSLAAELAETVIGLCGQTFDQCKVDQAALLARCHSAAQRLGSAVTGCALHLHPEDIAMLEPATLNGWRVVEDGSLERGALLFEGPDGSISDGPAEWRRAIAAAVRG
jgi:flagellar assembly protein FliH